MAQFPETELILTKENRVYHINLKAEDIADDVIVVGDQHRVAQISKFFSKIEFKTEHREFVTHTGIFNGKRVTVLSTGIGTDNIDIVVNELDAAVNINPETRELNPNLRSLNIVRLGTSGALQADIPVNGIVVSSHGLGLDGLLNFYNNWESVCDNSISDAFIKHTGWTPNLPYPYCVKASDKLISKFQQGTHIGITATAPGFYGPQGRVLRLGIAFPELVDRLTTFNYGQHRIANFEMETSGIYGLGSLLGHKCVSCNVILANRITGKFAKNPEQEINNLINNVLGRIVN